LEDKSPNSMGFPLAASLQRSMGRVSDYIINRNPNSQMESGLFLLEHPSPKNHFKDHEKYLHPFGCLLIPSTLGPPPSLYHMDL
jgi:hypothetical protein